MTTEFCQLQSSGLPATARVVGMRGREAMSSLYQYDVFLVVPGDDGVNLELGDGLGTRATLTLDRDDGSEPFRFHGILAAIELVHAWGDFTLLRATIVPKLWRLTLNRHSRLFTGQTLPDILRAVLEEGGLSSEAYELRLKGSYAIEEHICQYRESDFEFLSRWLEHEGLYYFFEHGDEGEKLIVADDKSAHGELAEAGVRYRANASTDAADRGSLHAFTCRHATLAGALKLKDYDYTKPTLEVSGRAEISASGPGEVAAYGARFFAPTQGSRLASIRAEEHRAREVVYRAHGSASHLRTGYVFRLEDHPRPAFEASYLVLAAEHLLTQTDSADLRELMGLEPIEGFYRVEITAIQAKTQFRQQRGTPWPRVYGFENAVIDGEKETEYAQIDEHGRYRLRFMFDEADLADGKASTWVRMMQPHGGEIEGWHFPLRKGTEVVVTFLGGDPDRPVIAGVVPTAHRPSPVTSANNTKNVIQTGGRNRLEIEDKKGHERITWSTPYANTMIRMGAPNDEHELIVRTDENAVIETGANWDIFVGGNETQYVSGWTDETFQGDYVTQAHSNRTLDIQGMYKQICHGPVDRTLFSNRTTKISGIVQNAFGSSVTESIAASHSFRVGGKQSVQVGADQHVAVGGASERSVGANEKRTIGGNLEETVSGTVKQTVMGACTWFKQDAHVQIVLGATSDTFIGIKNSNQIGASISIKVAGEVSTTVGASLDMKDGLRLSLTGGLALSVDAGASVKVSTIDSKSASVSLTKSALKLLNSGVTLFE